MTNFELITLDELALALWLSDGRMDCDMCPAWKECDGDVACFRNIYEWLKSDAEQD